MLSSDDDQEYEYTARREEDPTKCRLRRYRRRQMRRLVTGGAPISPPPEAEEGNNVGAETTEEAEEVVVVPVVGTMAVAGRLREMEDEVRVKRAFCRPDVCGRRPVHFFGVYDGHGGPHVAALCKDKLHILLADELSRLTFPHQAPNIAGSSSASLPLPPQLSAAEQEGWWRVVLARCFQRMDELAMNTCACGASGFLCRCPPNESSLIGSAVVVAVLTEGHIIVANVGDSRAVLCRGGIAIPLSYDHKPDRPDELARIEAAGGRVLFFNGARVQGILAMSRAIGDKFLKQVITAEPEITFTRRHPEDEFLILASDGLWDVMSNEVACEVTRECLRDNPRPTVVPHPTAVGQLEARRGNPLYPSQSASAAAMLTRLALGRRSGDNISVIVVDLKRSEWK